jgi:3-hydroxyisobutyrate dehydrogenase
MPGHPGPASGRPECRLVLGIHVLLSYKGVDGRDKPGHDGAWHMTDIKRIGFIGMGNMGVPMAANLVRGGFEVTAYDIAPDRAQRFAKHHGARASASLIELGQSSDAIVTMLPSGREVRHALLEADGGALTKSLRPGSFVVDMSSSAPVGTRELGRELAARKIALVDAPVSGGVPRAKDGTLAIMIGGEASAVAAVKPALAHMGTKLFEVGSLGCGHAMKALNNFLAGTSFAAASEALRVGKQFGLDPAAMIDVINVSTGRSFPTDLVMKQHVLSGNFATGFALGLLAKDVGIAADLAAQVGAQAPIVQMISQMWGEARDGLGGDCDHSRAAAYWERSATSM